MMYKTRRKLWRGCSIEQRRQRLESNIIAGQEGPSVFVLCAIWLCSVYLGAWQHQDALWRKATFVNLNSRT